MNFPIGKYIQSLQNYIPSRDIIDIIIKDVFFLNLCTIKTHNSFHDENFYINFSFYGDDDQNDQFIFHLCEHKMLSDVKEIGYSWENYCNWKSQKNSHKFIDLASTKCKHLFFVIMKVNYVDNIFYLYPNKCWLTLEFLPHLEHDSVSYLAPKEFKISKDFQICYFKKRKFNLKMF